jgi:hypothetical protein
MLEAVSLGYGRREVKPTTRLHLVLRLRNVELYLYSPIRLHGMVLINEVQRQLYLYYIHLCFS